MEKQSFLGCRPAGKGNQLCVRDGYAVQEAKYSEGLFLLGWKGQARAKEHPACHANTSLLGLRSRLVLALGVYLHHHVKDRGCSSWPFTFTSTAVLRALTNTRQSAHGYHPFYRLTFVISLRPPHKKHMAFLLKVASLEDSLYKWQSLGINRGILSKSSLSVILYSKISPPQRSLVCPTALYLFFIPIHRYYQILWHPYLFVTAGSNLFLFSLCGSPSILSLLQNSCFHPMSCITLNSQSPVSWDSVLLTVKLDLVFSILTVL